MPATWVERQVSIRTSADKFFQKLHFRNLDEKEVWELFDHTVDGRREVAAAGSFSLDLGGITTVGLVYMEADAALDVVLDGETITITPLTSNKVAVLFAEGAYSSITITNPDATTSVNMVWLLAGT